MLNVFECAWSGRRLIFILLVLCQCVHASNVLLLSFRSKGKWFQMSILSDADPFLSFGRLRVFAIWMLFAVSLSHNCIFFLPVSVSFFFFFCIFQCSGIWLALMMKDQKCFLKSWLKCLFWTGLSDICTVWGILKYQRSEEVLYRYRNVWIGLFVLSIFPN